MVAETALAGRRAVRFDSGGAHCAAWHFGPGTTGACVVMAHGLGAIKEVGLERFARRFLEAGHDVLAFDYRGFGETGGEPRQVVDVGAQKEDWRAAVAFGRSLRGYERIGSCCGARRIPAGTYWRWRPSWMGSRG